MLSWLAPFQFGRRVLSTLHPPHDFVALANSLTVMPPVNTSAGETSTATANPTTPVNVKLLLIGNASVGKSSLLLRFSDEQWIPEDEATATIGVDFRVSCLPWCGSGLWIWWSCATVVCTRGDSTSSCIPPFSGCIQKELTPIFCDGPGPQDGGQRAQG